MARPVLTERAFMKQPLRVLIVDDSQADAELAIHALRKAGYEPTGRIVDTEHGYLAALEEAPDLILCDHRMPRFDVVRALELLTERRLDIPLILLSGTIDGEQGAAAVRRGAAEYIFKDRLETLAVAVYRTLRTRRGRAR